MAKETIPVVETEATAQVATDGAENVGTIRKSQSEIIKELCDKGAKLKKPVKVRNLVVAPNEEGWLNVRITIDGVVDGFVRDADTGEYVRAQTSTIFTTIDNLIGIIKEDGRFLDKVKNLKTAPDYAMKFFGGGTITLLVEEVPANTMWHNPFAVRDIEDGLKDFDRIKHHIVGFEPNPMVKKMDLLTSMAGVVDPTVLADLTLKML